MKLTIGNSLCRLEGLTVPEFKALRALLSYSEDPKKSYYGGGFKSNRRYLISKRGEFPTGLLYITKKWLSGKLYETVDTRVKPKCRRHSGWETLFIPGSHPTPYPEQTNAALVAQQACRGIICGPTGTGKSLIIAQIIDTLMVPTLVVVPSVELKRQLTESLTKWFGPDVVGGFVRVENVDALSMSPLNGCECVIIDEFHHSGAKTYRQLNQKAWGGVYYKIGLTATPFRSQDHERLLLESVLSQVIYRINYQDAVKNARIVPMEAYYVDLPPTPCESNNWQHVYSELVVKNMLRNRRILDMLTTLRGEGKATLCLVKEVQHALTLSEASGVPAVVGTDKESRINITRFNSGEIKQLIGTTGMIGEGVDTKPAEYVILAAGGKSKNAFMQQCGRGFRTYPGKESCKIIMFRDKSHKWLAKHFNECVKFLKDEYGVKPMKLE